VALTPEGEAHLREFLEGGSGFVGFCAGAYWAADTVVFGEQGFDTATGYTPYDYDLALWPGTIKGPFAWTPWLGGTQATLQPIAIDTTLPSMLAAGMPAETRVLYGGGGWMTDAAHVPAGYEVWARAVPPAGAGGEGAGEATIVRFVIGSGNVILSAYHPDVLVNSLADGMVMQVYPEPTMTWDTGNQTQGQVNLLSWNLTRAMITVAQGDVPVPLAALPAAPAGTGTGGPGPFPGPFPGPGGGGPP
jgi:hypothetical protein